MDTNFLSYFEFRLEFLRVFEEGNIFETTNNTESMTFGAGKIIYSARSYGSRIIVDYTLNGDWIVWYAGFLMSGKVLKELWYKNYNN